MNNEIKRGRFMNEKTEEIWRGKAKKLYQKSNQEEKFMINEILKKYQSNKDELKGYDYKYVLELSDLLGSKDKNFSKKRLELYHNRIKRLKNNHICRTEKDILINVPNSPNIKSDIINKKNPKTFMTNIFGTYNYNKTYNNFYNKGKKMNNSNQKNYQNIDIYNKTSYKYNSPMKIASLKYLLTHPKSNSCNKRDNILTSFYLTQYNNTNDEDSLDTTSLVGKEAFLFSGDKEKYHEYLQKEFKFFDQPELREAKYLFEKQKRVKLFKRLSNAINTSMFKADNRS